ncbi:MAG: hypothetical protein SH817_01020 [Leptospira sp.]|nr:hypothetical protein [Leptospira sp.]
MKLKLYPYFFFVFFISLIFGCQSISYTLPKDNVINLDGIKILSSNLLSLYDTKNPSPNEENSINFDLGDSNKLSTEILINYKTNGINLIEDINSGKIINPKIILRNHKGEILDTHPLQTDTITAIEFLSQRIELNGKIPPGVGEYISFQIEMIYLAPFIDIACANGNQNCNLVKNVYSNKSGNQTSDNLESNRSYVKSKIANLNKDRIPSGNPGEKITIPSSTNLGDAEIVNYREWKLTTSPTYFKVLAILKNGKKIEEQKAEVIEIPKLPIDSETEVEKFAPPKHEKEIPTQKENHLKKRKKTIYLP